MFSYYYQLGTHLLCSLFLSFGVEKPTWAGVKQKTKLFISKQTKRTFGKGSFA